MEAGELAQAATELLEHYRGVLLVDPFYRVKVEISEGDYVSVCALESAPLTWVLKLNPARHESVEDVQYSAIEALLKVLFYAVDVADPSRILEAKEGLVSRLATAIAGLPLGIEEESDDSQSEN